MFLQNRFELIYSRVDSNHCPGNEEISKKEEFA